MSRDKKIKGETWTGITYWEDENGNREYEGETWTGRKYREDSSGNRSYEEETFTGRKYHEDHKGNRTYDSEIETGKTWTGKDYEQKKEGCFLSTACCNYAGLDDNCYELNQLRDFRDNYVLNLPQGSDILEEYYLNSPIIVSKIMESSNKNIILSNIFLSINKAIDLIQSGNKESAFKCYEKMYFDLLNVTHKH